MTTNVKPNRKKFDKLTIAAIIAVVALVLGTLLPCFAFPKTVVYENSLIVSERNNMHFTNIVVDVVTIDENGKVGETTARIQLEGEETEYRFVMQDLQEILQTEDQVYIKGLTDKVLLHCSFFTPVVGVFYTIIVIVALFAVAMVGIWGMERFMQNTKRVFHIIWKNIRKKRSKE